MQEPGEWNASEDDGICAVMWCDANDENKKLTLYTTTPHVQTLHHQDSPVTMSGAKNALEYSLRDDKFMSSTEAEKLDEMKRREEDGRREEAHRQDQSILKSKDGLNQMVQDLVENEEAGSIRQYLQMDGELRPGDVLRIATIFEDLGFTSEEDLDILATAFFETMADAENVPAVMVFKIWKTLHRPNHVPTEDRHGVRGCGFPSYPATRGILEKMALNKRQWENRTPPQKSNVVNQDGRESPAEKVGTSSFEDLHETGIRVNEESAHMMKTREEMNLTPHRTSTCTPAYKRIAPGAARVAFSTAEEYAPKQQLPTQRRRSGLLNPDALHGRDEGAVTLRRGRIIYGRHYLTWMIL
jgi:hypothetical protein